MGVIEIEVKPGGRSSSVKGYDFWRNRLKIEVKAPPSEGKANREVIELLSKIFGVDKRDISIVSGSSSHFKSVEVKGMEGKEIERRIQKFKF